MDRLQEDPCGPVDATVLGWPRVMAGTAFASPGYYVKGRAFAFWEGGGLVVKLPEEARGRALSRPGARRYTVPRGSGPEWALVPAGAATTAELVDLLRAAYEFVGGEPAPV